MQKADVSGKDTRFVTLLTSYFSGGVPTDPRKKAAEVVIGKGKGREKNEGLEERGKDGKGMGRRGSTGRKGTTMIPVTNPDCTHLFIQL